ncbi:MAG TPA: histidine kinase [Trebonia sp.]|nr:histidine kinase [Trebonia sp.]
MVNAWTWGLLAGIGAATILTYVLARVLKRSRRAATLGALLVPVTGLWLWAFGITAENQQAVTTQSFSTMLAVGKASRVSLSPAIMSGWATVGDPKGAPVIPVGSNYVALDPASGAAVAFGKVITVFRPGQPVSLVTTVSSSPAATFWMGMCILGVIALIAVVASRQAGYLAGIGLVAFGLYQLIAVALFSPSANGTAWYDWLYGMTSRGTVCGLAVASVIAGLVLIRYTVVHDMLQRMTLTSRVELLTQTRAEAVDAAAAELRRLERDLHDGAQARLVAIGLSLRALEKMIPLNPAAATALAVECRDASAQALADLRDLVRGIYPPVLAERGLGDAVRALALDSPVKVASEIDLPGRPPAPVEAAVYFAIAEALSNVAKHADARRALVRVYHDDGMLRAEVTDDGQGGADPTGGTGLTGIERRLAAFDGILAVSSPVGGPTIVVIEVPCELSSPKISTC